jgi:DNA-binding MarR family transcriptional regulator
MPSQTAAPRLPRADQQALERDARDLYHALTDLVRVYQFRDRNLICCHDISVTQCYALDALVRAGPLTLGALAADLMLDKSTASRVVEALDRKGYVRRTTHPGDGRAVQLSASARGRALAETVRREQLAEERAILTGLPEDVRRAAVGVVRELAKLAAKRAGRGDACCGGDACEVQS